MDKQILNIIHVYQDKQVLFYHYFPYVLIKHEQEILISIKHKESKPKLNISKIIIYILLKCLLYTIPTILKEQEDFYLLISHSQDVNQ